MIFAVLERRLKKNEIGTYQHTTEVVLTHSERREDDRGAQDAPEDRDTFQVLYLRKQKWWA